MLTKPGSNWISDNVLCYIMVALKVVVVVEQHQQFLLPTIPHSAFNLPPHLPTLPL